MPTSGESVNRFFDVEEGAADAATAFHSPKARHLYDWWRTARNGGLPSRDQFDILDHKLIIGNVFLTEVQGDGTFLLRLRGGVVIEITGQNRTGEVVRGNGPALGHPPECLYSRIVESRACRRCVGSVLLGEDDLRRFEAVGCPLSGDGGKTINMIIGVMDLIR